MGKGKGGDGNKQKTIGLSLNAASTTQNPGAGIGEQFRGVASDAMGMAIGAGAALLFKALLDKVWRKFFGGPAPEIDVPLPGGLDRQGIEFGIGKSIKAVADRLGRKLTGGDFNAVSKAYFEFPGNNGMDQHKAIINPMIGKMIAASAYIPDAVDDDDSDDSDGDDSDA